MIIEPGRIYITKNNSIVKIDNTIERMNSPSMYTGNIIEHGGDIIAHSVTYDYNGKPVGEGSWAVISDEYTLGDVHVEYYKSYLTANGSVITRTGVDSHRITKSGQQVYEFDTVSSEHLQNVLRDRVISEICINQTGHIEAGHYKITIKRDVIETTLFDGDTSRYCEYLMTINDKFVTMCGHMLACNLTYTPIHILKNNSIVTIDKNVYYVASGIVYEQKGNKLVIMDYKDGFYIVNNRRYKVEI